MRIAIIGPGLIGRSISLAAHAAQRDLRIIEIDRGQPLEGARGVDLIVLATPVDVTLDIIRTHTNILQDAFALDTGSTKQAIMAAARASGLTDFVGGHPMAGAATSGAGGARADLFHDRPWFLVPHGASARALETTTRFVASLGAHPVLMDDDGTKHDRVMAALSHMPQVVASALMVTAAAATSELQWAGAGLRDTTRLADSAGTVWQSILDTNAEHLRPLLLTLARDLESLAARLGDGRAVTELFDKANRARRLAFGSEHDDR